MKRLMSELNNFLKQCRERINAMEHWCDRQKEAGRYSDAEWNEGPYPDMKKLVEICEVLSEACDMAIKEDGIIESKDRRLLSALTKVDNILSSKPEDG